MSRLTCVLIVLLALAGAAAATNGYVQQVVTPVQVAPVAVVSPAVIQVPAYTTGYSPGTVDVEAFQGLRGRVAALEAKVDALEKKLAALQPGPAPGPQPQPAPPQPGPQPSPKPDPFAPANAKPAAKAPAPAQAALPALFARSCISCHKEGGKEEGSLALAKADGTLADLDDRQFKAVFQRLTLAPDAKGFMPPKKSGHEPASPTELGEVLSVLVRK